MVIPSFIWGNATAMGHFGDSVRRMRDFQCLSLRESFCCQRGITAYSYRAIRCYITFKNSLIYIVQCFFLLKYLPYFFKLPGRACVHFTLSSHRGSREYRVCLDLEYVI